jgi:hypothetical protein
MTFEDCWQIGARLLGVYLVVLAGLYAVGAVGTFGIGLPEGSNRLVFASIPALQGLVAGGAGFWLIRRSGAPAPASAREGIATGNWVTSALQLLGIFFVVSGAAELIRVSVDSYLISAEWAIRGSEMAAGAVEAGAGALLTLMPTLVAGKLNDFAGRGGIKPWQSPRGTGETE